MEKAKLKAQEGLENCSCREYGVSDGIQHCYNGHPCYVKPTYITIPKTAQRTGDGGRVKKYLTDKETSEIYRLMDSFLVESKDQNGNERSIERLNQDRHLFVKNMQSFIDSLRKSDKEALIERIDKIKLPSKIYRTDSNRNVRKMHVQMLKHEGYNKALKDVLSLLKEEIK